MTEEDVLAFVNRLANEVIGREPRYRFYQYKNRYFAWTTEKCELKGRHRFVAFVRVELVSKRTKRSRTFKTLRRMGFARRCKAKERAYGWYEKWRREHQEEIYNPVGSNNSHDKSPEPLAKTKD